MFLRQSFLVLNNNARGAYSWDLFRAFMWGVVELLLLCNRSCHVDQEVSPDERKCVGERERGGLDKDKSL